LHADVFFIHVGSAIRADGFSSAQHGNFRAPMVRHLHIFGQVQGVGFRYRFSEQAQRLGVTGWVRNRRGGSVEAMIEGTPEAVDALVSWARVGPPAARVERVEVSPAEGAFAGFELRPTA
jgi:acylphosphatase